MYKSATLSITFPAVQHPFNRIDSNAFPFHPSALWFHRRWIIVLECWWYPYNTTDPECLVSWDCLTLYSSKGRLNYGISGWADLPRWWHRYRHSCHPEIYRARVSIRVSNVLFSQTRAIKWLNCNSELSELQRFSMKWPFAPTGLDSMKAQGISSRPSWMESLWWNVDQTF